MREALLELLLAHGDDIEPVLKDGLPLIAADCAPKPRHIAIEQDGYGRHPFDTDPNSLVSRRWGVVVPEGRTGDGLLDAIAPLVQLREREQRAPVVTYRVPPNLDMRAAAAWKEDVYFSEDSEMADRPGYLMVLGDPDWVSLELQLVLNSEAFVGRVHFVAPDGADDLGAYAAYAEKVVRYAELGTSAERPNLLFHAARSETNATESAQTQLLRPCHEMAKRHLDGGKLSLNELRALEIASVDEFIAAVGNDHPSVLMSASLGLGAPRSGWSSVEEQRRKQGALVLAGKDVLDADRLGSQTFLPGGLWLLVAGLGAGTPNSSSYSAWLSVLSKEGDAAEKAKSVLANMAGIGSRPFLAALPQAALANPHGPQAIIGQMDLSWMCRFPMTSRLSVHRISRYILALRAMVSGHRVGVAVDAFTRLYREMNEELSMSYQLEADARNALAFEPAMIGERGQQWMLRNEARSYMLLGDPAVRLALRENIVGADPKKAPRPEIVAISASTKEDAVLKLLQGDESPKAIAQRVGTTLPELFSWLDAYRHGGRTKL